jgi:hypothetical protein
VSATLVLTREGHGIELRRGSFDAEVDGNGVGSIEWHQTLELPMEPGRHTLRIHKGRYSSHSHPFEVIDGETVSFQCHGAMIWPRYVVSIVKPNLGISLKPA